ncbi:MAG TPA: ABC transporter permease [Candidatus Polarisedimenticolia bacterium]
MTGYLLRRTLLVLPLLFGVATVVFALIHLIPGDPVEVMLGAGAGAADVADLRHRLGLDRPLPEQYGAFIGGLARGDLGLSLRYHDPIAGLLLERAPATGALALASLGIAFLLAIPGAVGAAMKPGGRVEWLTSLGAVLALSIPTFWLGPILILLFAIRLNWLPASGFDSPAALLLPALTLALPLAGLLTRLIRATLLEQTSAIYLRAARARGLSLGAAMVRHALRNALAPVITVIALQLGSLMTGAILTETVFAWPGLGRLLVQAISTRDYPLVQGSVLLIAMTYILTNLAADLLHGLLDPRTVA